MGDSKDGCIQLFSGILFNPAEPRIEDIHITDIAHSLSRLCRFTGHIEDMPYSGTGHFAVEIANLAPDLAFPAGNLLDD